jgi:hypothetical protein
MVVDFISQYSGSDGMKVPLHHCPIQRDARKNSQDGYTSMPVITVPLSFSEPPDVCERSTIGPVGAIDFVWESGVVQLLFEKGKCLVAI